MVESFAAGGEHTHVALHVDTGKESGAEARTTLSVNVAAPTPSEWRVRSNVGIPRSLSIGRTAVIERRHYVRTPQCVVRTLRVSDFAAGREQVALEVLSEYGSGVTLSLHAGVVPISACAAPHRARRASRGYRRPTSHAAPAFVGPRATRRGSMHCANAKTPWPRGRTVPVGPLRGGERRERTRTWRQGPRDV